jgi:hypothetical protein
MDIATMVVVLAQAAPTAPTQDTPSWMDTASWWIGLPVAIVAAVGTIYALPKVRREMRKLDLEILEKERALGVAKVSDNPAEVARIVAEPIFESRRAQDLILRFVLLYLLLQAWGLISGLLGSATSSALFALNRAVEGDASISKIIGTFIVAIVASLPNVVRSLLFVAIGWPLLLDSAKLLRFELPQFFYSDRTRHALIAIAVIAGLISNLLGAGLSLFTTL